MVEMPKDGWILQAAHLSPSRTSYTAW